MSKRITVLMQVTPGRSAEFETFMAEATARVRAEDPGCEMYDLFRSIDDETRYTLIESWTKAEDLEAHRSSEAMAHIGGMREFFAGPLEIYRYED
jgi:quinol monooxygenase YgiN